MKAKLAVCALTAAFSMCALSGCADTGVNSYNSNHFTLGAGATLVVATSSLGSDGFAALSNEVDRLLISVNNSLSVTLESSCIYKFNAADAGAKVEIDQISYELLTLSKQIYALTDGYFNPAVLYCEELFGFTHNAANRPPMPFDREGLALPEEKYVTAFCELAAHFNEVVLTQSDGAYYATKPDFTVSVEGDANVYSMKVDLSGIAKGWCADKVNEILNGHGAEYGYFRFSGGSSICAKKYAGASSGEYSLNISDPRGSEPFATIKVRDSMLSTSADNMEFYTVDGVRYCHIINAKTGAPIRTDIASVTVVGGTAAEADALTTALAAMGEDRAYEFMRDKLSDRMVFILKCGDDGSGGIITNSASKAKFSGKYAVIKEG